MDKKVATISFRATPELERALKAVAEARDQPMNNHPGSRESITRGPTNHRRGQAHGRAKYPDSLVALARDWHERGVSRAFIARSLQVPYDTLRDWLEYRTR